MANRNSSPYASAGWLLNEHIEKRRGLKSIAFEGGSKKKPSVDKATYATVCKTLQHLSTINSILNSDNKKLRKAIDFDSVRSKGLLYVMLYELLFGKYKSIRGGGKIKRLIMKHESELRKEAEVYGTDVIAGVNFPRYIRVNTLHTDTADVVDKLKQDLTSSKEEVNEESATRQAMYVDPHVPDLLVLPPTTSSWLHHDYNPVQSGQIVLQDKSSCFSALVMANGLGQGSNDDEPFDYIDACAAPGNKTCHLAALVNSSLDNDGSQSTKKNKKKKGKNKPKSTIYAFERSSTRHNILQERMNKLVPSTASSNEIKVEVEPIHGDFLRADPSDPKFANVRAIMLDPSCSGSGIVNSPDRWMEESSGGGGGDGDKKDDERIQSLSNFQLVALKHAMSFPTVDRIVYSTCSVYDEENEVVVSKALSEVVEMSQTDDNDDESWQLLAPKCLADWKRRGKVGGIGGLTKDQADCLVRCDGMDGDETNGFFVAFFVRNKLLLSSSENERIKIDDVGVPIYSGQFVDMCKAVTPPTNVADGGTKKLASNIDASNQQSRKEQPIPLQKTKKKNDTKTAAGDKKSAKKREKKMAWKRKQALLKSQRLKKKEDAAAAAEAKGDNK